MLASDFWGEVSESNPRPHRPNQRQLYYFFNGKSGLVWGHFGRRLQALNIGMRTIQKSEYMQKNNAIVLCFSPSLSMKYWKSLFRPLKNVFQSSIIFVKKNFEQELKMDSLISWGKTNYPGSKIVYFFDKSFRMKNRAFSGYANENVAMVKVQPALMVPSTCRSSKLIGVPWYSTTLVATIHEISHMFGLSHCSTPKCVMAKNVCERNSGFCWPCIARRSKLYRSRIFCKECYDKLKLSEIMTSD
jgi:hypothetical protein